MGKREIGGQTSQVIEYGLGEDRETHLSHTRFPKAGSLTVLCGVSSPGTLAWKSFSDSPKLRAAQPWEATASATGNPRFLKSSSSEVRYLPSSQQRTSSQGSVLPILWARVGCESWCAGFRLEDPYETLNQTIHLTAGLFISRQIKH